MALSDLRVPLPTSSDTMPASGKRPGVTSTCLWTATEYQRVDTDLRLSKRAMLDLCGVHIPQDLILCHSGLFIVTWDGAQLGCGDPGDCRGALSELRQIDLRGTLLRSLPESMARLAKLDKIDLRWISSFETLTLVPG